MYSVLKALIGRMFLTCIVVSMLVYLYFWVSLVLGLLVQISF